MESLDRILAETPEPPSSESGEGFRVDVHAEPDGARVCPCGDVDMATTAAIRRTLDECVAAGFRRVLLDLRDVTFLDSTGAHLVLDATAAAHTARWELVLIEGPPKIQRTFELLGLRDRLPFVDAAELPPRSNKTSI